MKIKHTASKRILSSLSIALAIFVLSAPPQSGGQPIDDEPLAELIMLGEPALFSINPVPGELYQWTRNGNAVTDETNSVLIIEHVRASDAGLYSCMITNSTSGLSIATIYLEVYTVTPDDLVVVFGTPIVSSGSSGSCPGKYQGYVTYYKTAAQGWGWTPSTNTTVYTATDDNRTNTKVEYSGDYGDEGCAQTSVTVPSPPTSPAYRFAIYFTNNVPTTNYAITLSGFNP